MKIPQKFKEVLEKEADKQPIRKSIEKVQIADKFKLFLRHQEETIHKSDRKKKKKKTRRVGRMRNYSDRKLLRIMKAEAEKLNRTPTAAHFQNSKGLPSPLVYAQRWGSWNEAIRAVGLQPNFIIGSRKNNQNKFKKSPNDTSIMETPKPIQKFQEIELYATLSDQTVEGQRIVQELGTQLGLDVETIDQARDLYMRTENVMQQGRTRKSLASAAIYLAGKKMKRPITAYEIAQTTQISSRLLFHTVRTIEKKLKLEFPPLQLLDFFDGIAKQLLLDEDIKTSAKEILRQRITKTFSNGRNPRSIVAAAIYIAGLRCRRHITQDEIAEVAGITTVTIRNRYRVLAKKLGIDLKKYILPRYLPKKKIPHTLLKFKC